MRLLLEVVFIAGVCVWLSNLTLRVITMFCSQTVAGWKNRKMYREHNVFSSKDGFATFAWQAFIRVLSSALLFEHQYYVVVVLIWWEFSLVHVVMGMYWLYQKFFNKAS